MSDPLEPGFDLPSAVAFNTRHGALLWGHIQMIEDLGNDYPGLHCTPDTEAFAEATLELQRNVFDDDIELDGKFGSGTWAAAKAEYIKPPKRKKKGRDDWIIQGGVKRAVKSGTKIITWDEEGGLDLHRDGGWSKRSQKPNIIVVHWGGRNAKSCRNALASRDLSSHFGTDRGVIYQWLDIAHRAWHAGSKANMRSVGIDICQQPTVGLADWYDQRDYGLEIIDNPSPRGADKVLTLHPDTVKSTADLLRVLTQSLQIPLAFPRRDRVFSPSELARFRGILGHHHISKRKWDVAPWLPAIKEELGV